ncbi:MAG: hypothetical protein ACTSVK_16095 [Promethearchaeota archaeon]
MDDQDYKGLKVRRNVAEIGNRMYIYAKWGAFLLGTTYAIYFLFQFAIKQENIGIGLGIFLILIIFAYLILIFLVFYRFVKIMKAMLQSWISSHDQKLKFVIISWITFYIIDGLIRLIGYVSNPYQGTSLIGLLWHYYIFGVLGSILQLITVFMLISWIQSLKEFMVESLDVEIIKSTNLMKIAVIANLIPFLGIIGKMVFLVGLYKTGAILEDNFSRYA